MGDTLVQGISPAADSFYHVNRVTKRNSFVFVFLPGINLMRKTFIATFIAALLYSLPLVAQSVPPPEATGAIPVLTCIMSTSVDSVLFRDNTYVPSRFTISVVVNNVGLDTAKAVSAYLVNNTRVRVISLNPVPIKNTLDPAKADTLLSGQSGTARFEVEVNPREDDGFDTLRIVVASQNGGVAVCSKIIWVQHVWRPKYQITCAPRTTNLVFDDALNDYNPNPVTVDVIIRNIGDADSKGTQLVFVNPPGTSPAEAPVKDVGLIPANGGQWTGTFDIKAIKRSNDTCVTLVFRVVGRGGIADSIRIGECQSQLCIPEARTALYDLKCDFLPDSVRFKGGQYVPEPFDFKVDITNIGTADGQEVKAQIILPPSIALVTTPNNTSLKDVGRLDRSASTTVSWQLRALSRDSTEWVKICVRVFDKFENTAICCDSMVVDSVRRAKFAVICEGPDSLTKDPTTGVYLPNPFDVRIRIRNTGSDPADSVCATLTFNTPQTGLRLTGGNNTQCLPGQGRIEVDSVVEFVWSIVALRHALGTNEEITIKVNGVDQRGDPLADAFCNMTIYVPPLGAPFLEPLCETVPPDTVHFDQISGKYVPEVVQFVVKVVNTGGSQAQGVRGTVLPPPGFIMPDTELPTKDFTPFNVVVGDTAVAVWRMIPTPQRIGKWFVFSVQIITDDDQTYRCSDSVFVVGLPFVSALLIPQDNVGYYGGENIHVPVFIDESDQKGIKDIDLYVHFDPAIVDFVGIQRAGTLTSSWTEAEIEKPDPVNAPDLARVHITNSTTPLSGSGTLLYLEMAATFGAPPNHLKTAVSNLRFDSSLTQINGGTIATRLTDGMVTVAGECIRPMNATDKYVVAQNSPNPFNPTTSIQFNIPEDTHVKLVVMDALGREVVVLVNEFREKGSYNSVFDASSVPSGVYFYRFEAPNYHAVRKMIVAK